MGIKKFKFRLEKVLQFRVGVRDEKKAVLVKKNQQLQEEQAELERLFVLMRENSPGANGQITVDELIIRDRYAERLKKMITEQKERIVRTEIEVATAKDEYLLANQEVRALEVLKEKRQKEHETHIEHETAKFLDELTTQSNSIGEKR